MKPIWKNIIALIVFVIFVVAGIVVATLIHLKGPSFWILAGVFAALGLIGAGALLWWWHSQPSPAEPGEPEGSTGAMTGEQEIDFLVRQAESRLRSSRLGRGAGIGKQPVILLAGEAGSGKTSVVLESGIECELLAGQISQDEKIVPTRAVNLWFTSQAVLTEAAGGLLTQPAAWARLIRRIAPRGMSSVFGRKGPAPRAAIVCVSCETFLKPGGAEANAGALRALRSSLEECSHRLGISLPLYVLFTKLDLIPSFSDYAGNFVPDEAAQVFGATLPILPNLGTGLFAERETKRLTAAFDELFYGLSDGRVDFLAREHNAERLPGAYEFPREFRKLRAPIVQFLVDLCRPSQLTARPVLRGFYFAGRRTVLVETEPAAETTRPAATPVEEDMGATRVISAAQIQRLAAQQRQAVPGASSTQVFDLRGMAAGGGRTKAVQQPVFLGRLFNDIFLRDRAGLATSGSSSKVNFWRRFLLASAAVICLIFSIGFIVSFLGNRTLETQVTHAAEAAQANSPNTSLMDQLQQLEALRKPLEKIGNYNRNGEPWRLGWWLYTGHKLYPIACSAYAQEFRQALLGPTQTSLVSSLRGLPTAPTGDYGVAYDELRAYLITTTNPEESRQPFLTPEMYKVWSAGRAVSAQEEQLARAQLDFYGNTLQNEAQLQATTCFASQADQDAIAHARAYLNLFPPEERVYRAMLADAAKSSAPVIYSHAYPNSIGIVTDAEEIAGAYTKEGWAAMQKDLDNPQPFMKGEPWVLGTQVNGTVDVITLQQHLRQRYQTEFAGAWRQFLAAARVSPYSNLSDASRKLGALTGNTSPLLELLWLISHNVSASPGALKEFQPVAKVVPPSDQTQYVSPANQNYLGALLNLKSSVDQLAQQPQAPVAPGAGGAPNPVAGAAAQATTTTAQIAQAFTPDPSGRVDGLTQKLLLEPITNVQSAMPKPGEALNGQGRSFCAQFRPLFGQYPFSSNPRSPAAAPAQFTALFQPGGALSNFYTQNLASVLTFAGTGYVANPASPAKISPAFLAFFNRAMGLQRAFYPNGAGQPQLRFSLAPLPPQGVKQFSVTIDGQTMSYPGGAVQIIWSPLTAAATKKLVDGGSVDYPGPWGVFSLFREAEWKPNGAGYDLTWVQKSGDQILRLPNGQAETSGVHLDMMGAPPIFEPGYFSTLSCVSKVAQ